MDSTIKAANNPPSISVKYHKSRLAKNCFAHAKVKMRIAATLPAINLRTTGLSDFGFDIDYLFGLKNSIIGLRCHQPNAMTPTAISHIHHGRKDVRATFFWVITIDAELSSFCRRLTCA